MRRSVAPEPEAIPNCCRRFAPDRACFLDVTTSSPVETTAAFTWPPTVTSAKPWDARRAIVVGRILSPDPRIFWPSAKSQPRRLMNSPGSTSTFTTIWSPTRVVSSCMITASAPAGIGAPVKIRTVSPGETPSSRSIPAGCSPITCSRVPFVDELATTAYPSMAELSNIGSGNRATTSRALKQSSASESGTIRSPSDWTLCKTRRRASSSLIMPNHFN